MKPLKPYDDIVELDNVLPPWWLGLFYIAIIFSLIYLLGYHLFHAFDSQEAEFKSEQIALEQSMQRVAAKALVQEKAKGSSELSQANLEKGKLIFSKNCASCHGPNGEGGIGPSFMDTVWIHGGDLASIQNTVRIGVPEKGMIPWQNALRPQEILEVSAYVKSLEKEN
jgi:cytochrome c oxidase cbb3-type subunit 3